MNMNSSSLHSHLKDNTDVGFLSLTELLVCVLMRLGEVWFREHAWIWGTASNACVVTPFLLGYSTWVLTLKFLQLAVLWS